MIRTGNEISASSMLGTGESLKTGVMLALMGSINYPADGTSLPRKQKNEVLPLIFVNALFLATPGTIMEKRIFWL